MDQLDRAFETPRQPGRQYVELIRHWAERDAADLEGELRSRAEAQKAEAIKDLTKVGVQEATSLRRLLEDQRGRILERQAEPEDLQLSLFEDPEAEQLRRDRRHWKTKLERLTADIAREPDRVRQAYKVVADRLETIGLVYLWPEGN